VSVAADRYKRLLEPLVALVLIVLTPPPPPPHVITTKNYKRGLLGAISPYILFFLIHMEKHRVVAYAEIPVF
jgi:hypothetical protein